jgi:hypothetical protein
MLQTTAPSSDSKCRQVQQPDFLSEQTTLSRSFTTLVYRYPKLNSLLSRYLRANLLIAGHTPHVLNHRPFREATSSIEDKWLVIS